MKVFNDMPDWLKNVLVLLVLAVVLFIVWELVKAILIVAIWAVAIAAVGFALHWVAKKLGWL